jgi:hypothetical protein
VATVRGHLDQICKDLKSIKRTKPLNVPDPAGAYDYHTKCFPSSEVGDPITHYCYTVVIWPQPNSQVHFDQAGKFPVASSTGDNYQLSVYEYDSNGILAKQMLKCTGLCILQVYMTIHTSLTAAGLWPKQQQQDNKASFILKDYMTGEGINKQLFPPGVDCHNAAEYAFCTFKNHFIAGLYITP